MKWIDNLIVWLTPKCSYCKTTEDVFDRGCGWWVCPACDELLIIAHEEEYRRRDRIRQEVRKKYSKKRNRFKGKK